MSSFNWSKGNLNDLQRTWRTADGENSADYRNDSLKSDILVSDRMSFKSTVTLQHLPPLSGGSSSDPVRFWGEPAGYTWWRNVSGKICTVFFRVKNFLFSGLLWTKQIFCFCLESFYVSTVLIKWLDCFSGFFVLDWNSWWNHLRLCVAFRVKGHRLKRSWTQKLELIFKQTQNHRLSLTWFNSLIINSLTTGRRQEIKSNVTAPPSGQISKNTSEISFYMKSFQIHMNLI